MKKNIPYIYFISIFSLFYSEVISCVKFDTIIISDVNCESLGYIEVKVSGGVGPFEYSIDGGANLQGSNYFGELATGTYDVVVIDANFCPVYRQVQLKKSYHLDMTLRKIGNKLISSIENASFRWFDCNRMDLPIEGVNGNFFSATQSGNYMLEAETPICIDSSKCYRIDIMKNPKSLFENQEVQVQFLKDGNIFLKNKSMNFENLIVLNILGSTIDFQIKTNPIGAIVNINGPRGIYFLNTKDFSVKVLKP